MSTFTCNTKEFMIFSKKLEVFVNIKLREQRKQ